MFWLDTREMLSGSTVMQGPLSQVPSLKFSSPPVLSRSLLFLSPESLEQELRSPAVAPDPPLKLPLKADNELPRPLSSVVPRMPAKPPPIPDAAAI